MSEPEFLGDGVYVEFDGYGFVLTTHDGYRVTNRVVLEPSVYCALTLFVERIKTVEKNDGFDDFNREISDLTRECECLRAANKALSEALRQSQSWLTCYPGHGALPQWVHNAAVLAKHGDKAP